MMILICVGHSRPGDRGAVSVAGVTEWEFNVVLGENLVAALHRRNVAAEIMSAYQGDSYGAAMRYVADECRRLRAAAAIELHFNSGPPTARGHEWLYWHSSSKARSLAEGLRAEFEADFPELPARGAKARSPADRGAAFLRLVPCPAVIAEPFFGSNADDWTWAAAHRPQMALAMARALVSWRGQK